MIQDPADQIVAAVRRTGDGPPSPADVDMVALARRRFGLALPPPFASLSSGPVPVRRAAGTDGAAIAGVKWRSWRAAYGGVLPAAVVDDPPVDPTAGQWITRALVPSSRRHAVFVAGTPGAVVGFAEVRPVRDADLAPTDLELSHLYVDPTAQGRGVGTDLVAAVRAHAAAQGAGGLWLWVFSDNDASRVFYESRGWTTDGTEKLLTLGPDARAAGTRYRCDG